MSARPTVRWLLAAGIAGIPGAQAVYAVQYLTVDQAQHQAFPSATVFVPVAVPRDSLLKVLEPSLKAPDAWSPRIAEARAADRRLGWLIVDQVIGKTDLITFSLAISPDGAVTSLEILEYREAHGSEVRLAAWRRQFAGKRAGDPVAVGSDIKNISGATLSCRHVAEGVRRALMVWDRLLRTRT
jgi:hypothetical protein